MNKSKAKKTISHIGTAILILGCFFMYGSVGASDVGSINTSELLVRFAITIPLVTIGYFMTKKGMAK